MSNRVSRSGFGWRRRALLLRTLPWVLGIVAAKVLIERLGWEFVGASPLHASVVAGAFFIIALMLSGLMVDYKESERVPTEIASALESIYREGAYVKELHPSFDLDRLAATLSRIPHTLRDDLVQGTQRTIATVDQITESFLEMDRLGVPPNYIARLKQEQANTVRNLLRVSYVQRIDFLPSAYTLVESIVFLLLGLVLFTQIDTRVTDLVIVGFIAFIFLYILQLLRLLDTPFREASAGVDDISLFQIDAIHDEMHARYDETHARLGVAAAAHTAHSEEVVRDAAG